MPADWKTQQMIKASGWPLAPELLEPEADFNARLEGGLVPLLWACSLGKQGVVAYMLDNGANVLDRTESGHGMLELAVRSENFQTVMLVIDSMKAAGAPAPAADLRVRMTQTFSQAHTNAKNRLQQTLKDWDKLKKKPA